MNKEENIDYINNIHDSYIKELQKQDEFIEQLQQENQSLKKENKILRENAEHNDKVVDKVNWENQLLKKQLEEIKSTNKVLSEELTKDKILKQDCLTTIYDIPIGDIPKLINQQKKFIEYLNSYIKLLSDDPDLVEKGQKDILEEVLLKYKESGE